MTKVIGDVLAQEVSTPMKYLGEQTASPDSSTTLTLPPGTNFVWFFAETAAVYYGVNLSGSADADSGGVVPLNGHACEGPLTNLTSIKVFSATGKVHCRYYQA